MTAARNEAVCPACPLIVEWVDGRFACPCGAEGDRDEFDRLITQRRRAGDR